MGHTLLSFLLFLHILYLYSAFFNEGSSALGPPWCHRVCLQGCDGWPRLVSSPLELGTSLQYVFSCLILKSAEADRGWNQF